MWVTKLLISPVKKRIFLSKNDQIWPKIGIFVSFGPGDAGSFGALLMIGWWLWRAGCISQDTYLLFGNPKISRNLFYDVGPEQQPSGPWAND